MDLDLLSLQLLDIFVLGLDEVVQPIYFHGHEGNLVLVILEVDLDVLVLVDARIEFVELYSIVVQLLIFTADDLVHPLHLLADGLVLPLDVPASLLVFSQGVVVVLQPSQGKLEFFEVFELVVELILQHLLVLLHESHLGESVFQLGILLFPGLYFLQPCL